MGAKAVSANRNAAVAEALARALGGGAGAAPWQSLGGGFSENFRVPWGREGVFLKLAPAAVLQAEADGLGALAQCKALRVPRVLALGETGGQGFLALEWLPLTDLGDEGRLGEAIAALHGLHYPSYGWSRDNFLGATPQANGWEDDWPRFFATRRLHPLLARAAAKGAPDLAVAAAPILAHIADFFPEAPPKALLHGDLWAGNKGYVGGQPAVFDPAVHIGDPECDLAMAALFGGFSQNFYAAHAAAHPPRQGWVERRVLYQLYHVLNHFELFGGGYARDARKMIGRLCSARS
ncbi:putative ketoamine kinase [Burkholderiales bacterium]|nr:putative ketoamine kinase [Burkholderiales bacterium]